MVIDALSSSLFPQDFPFQRHTLVSILAVVVVRITQYLIRCYRLHAVVVVAL